MNKRNIFIEFTATNNCNCNCKYCFENAVANRHEKRNIEEEQRQLKLIVSTCQLFDADKYDSLTISFWGGEPMLNLDFMIKMIEATYRYPFVRYHMYSNGILVEQYKKLVSCGFFNEIKHRFNIQLSYDGEPHHTIFRGNNSNRIFQTADLLKDNGASFMFKATLSFELLDKLPEVWKSYEDLYNKYGEIVQYSPSLDSTVEFGDEQSYKTWAKVLLEVANYEYKFILKHGHPLCFWFNTDMNGKRNCIVQDSVHVSNDGEMYICHGCAYVKDNEKLKYGNTKDIKSFFDVLPNMPDIYYLPNECKKCSATCCQICHVMHLDKTKDPFEQWSSCRSNNKYICKYFKILGFISNILDTLFLKN